MPEFLRGDAEIALAALEKDEWNFGLVSARLWRNKDFVSAAVKVNGFHLRFAPEPLRGNREIVLAAVRQQGLAFQSASNALRGDRDFVLEAVRQNGWALQYASSELRGCREIVLEAVRQDGVALRCASEEFRGDLEVVMAAVRQNGWALYSASNALQGDREIVLEAVQREGRALRDASRQLRGNQEIVLMAVRQNGKALEYASEELRGKKEIALAAIENTEDVQNILPYFSDDVRNDPVVAAAMLLRGECLGRGSALVNRLESVLLAVQALPKNFTRCVVDEASVLEVCRRWELSILHKIWVVLELEPPGMEGTGQVFVELSGLPVELRQVWELRHCAPVIGAALSLGCDWRKINSYPVY